MKHPALPASTETGKLGILHLKRLWGRCQAIKSGQLPGAAGAAEWAHDHGRIQCAFAELFGHGELFVTTRAR